MANNEFGDFQTPRALAAKVLKAIPAQAWSRVLEPTCGVGNFLHEAIALDAELVGVEVQGDYVNSARLTTAEIIHRDIFDMHLGNDISWNADGPLLVVGNPPWVTNAQLSRFDSDNRPDRVNLKNLSGYDAMTGSSNFDIAEYIWLKLIAELQGQSPTISLLCKTQVARNVLEYCAQFKLPVSSASLHMIDAKKWFNVAVDACLFTISVNKGSANYTCDLYESLEASAPSRRFGIIDGKLVADVDAYKQGRMVDGSCPIEWRQGMKHDAAAVMELVEAGGPTTRSGHPVSVEDNYLFPLLKCTDVFRNRIGLSKWVIVPQRALSDDTQQLAHVAPELWAYLNANADVLDGRKSSIYRKRPRFCVFGVGDYSFAPYKIAVSGLHKSAEFRLVGPLRGKPVFFDDTCYLLPFENATEAAIVTALLDTEPARNFFRALAFWDAKRPITKKLLQRIDLSAVVSLADSSEVVGIAQKHLSEIELTASEEDLLQALERLVRVWAGEESISSAGDVFAAESLF
ncbi:hypothetical protein [Nonomuraea wenchangensis]|uniref:hypothetical protein n=1 Tax=Nonomuraea wenchangensis TaxID=568860 RepID=UPI003412B79F